MEFITQDCGVRVKQKPEGLRVINSVVPCVLKSAYLDSTYLMLTGSQRYITVMLFNNILTNQNV